MTTTTNTTTDRIRRGRDKMTTKTTTYHAPAIVGPIGGHNLIERTNSGALIVSAATVAKYATALVESLRDSGADVEGMTRAEWREQAEGALIALDAQAGQWVALAGEDAARNGRGGQTPLESVAFAVTVAAEAIAESTHGRDDLPDMGEGHDFDDHND